MEEQRQGDWLHTASGAAMWPLDPRASEIRLEDVAIALSRSCRFTGHLKPELDGIYSVAQHAWYVSVEVYLFVQQATHNAGVATAAALFGLHHDDSEAYLNDIPRPLKKLPQFTPYRMIEERVQSAIHEALIPSELMILGSPWLSAVHDADMTVLATEARDLMAPPPRPWNPMPAPAPWRIPQELWLPRAAEKMYLDRHRNLIAGRG